MTEPRRFDPEQVFDLFGLSEEEREFIRNDTDGWQGARAEADRQREAFTEHVRECVEKHRREIDKAMGDA